MSPLWSRPDGPAFSCWGPLLARPVALMPDRHHVPGHLPRRDWSLLSPRLLRNRKPEIQSALRMARDDLQTSPRAKEREIRREGESSRYRLGAWNYTLPAQGRRMGGLGSGDLRDGGDTRAETSRRHGLRARRVCCSLAGGLVRRHQHLARSGAPPGPGGSPRQDRDASSARRSARCRGTQFREFPGQIRRTPVVSPRRAAALLALRRENPAGTPRGEGIRDPGDEPFFVRAEPVRVDSEPPEPHGVSAQPSL